MTRASIAWAVCIVVLGCVACGDGATTPTPRDDASASADGTTNGMDATRDGAPNDAGDARPPSPTDASTDAPTGTDVMTGVDGWGPLPDGGCRMVMCQSHTYQCGDCMDNDGDGRMDWQDPDCLGPCDNSESGFDLGIPGGGSAPCRLDCYFDQDTGAGNDTCRWDHRCDMREPSAPECRYSSPPPAAAECPATQAATCESFCRPLVPNGCDCFGCCELPGGSGRTVFLGSVPRNGAPPCSPATVNNPDSCRPCTQVPSCLNRCERCEVCIGRPVPPADCFMPAPPPDAGVRPDGGGMTTPDGGGMTVPDAGVRDGGTVNTGQCLPGVQPCGLPGQALCPTEYYCITGCCIRAPG